MDDAQHIKSVQTDSNGKNRLRYLSTKQRAKLASADVYRAYHRRGIGVTSAATREERLHNPALEESQRSQKRQRVSKADDGGRFTVIRQDNENKASTPIESDDDNSSAADCQSSYFTSELEIANDRNGSEIFGHFYRHVWPLVRSLPELLHHAPQVVQALLSYLLSPASSPGEQSSLDDEEREKKERYVVNLATTDVLHLMGALARDLRHEIHPFLHKDIMPRIIHDLLNPPVDPSVQQQPLNVTIVEAAFRTLSYIFRYDAEPIINQVEKIGQVPCLEQMRLYYGLTLANRRELVRRLAAECFAPLVRKIKTDAARSRHLRRILRALAASAAESTDSLDVRMKRAQADGVDGVSQLFFQVARGISGRLHSKGRLVVECLLIACTKDFSDKEIVVEVATSFFERLSHHLNASEFAVVVLDVLAVLRSQIPSSTTIADQENTSLSNCLKLIVSIVSIREGELFQGFDSSDKGTLRMHTDLMKVLRELCDESTFPVLSITSRKHVLKLLCAVWKLSKASLSHNTDLEMLLPSLLKQEALHEVNESPGSNIFSAYSPICVLLQELLPYLPRDIAMNSIGTSTLLVASRIAKDRPIDSMTLVHALAMAKIASDDDHDDDTDDVLFINNACYCHIPFAVKETLLTTAMINVENKRMTTERASQLGVFARCAAFLVALSDDSSDKKLQILYKRVSNWQLKVLAALGGKGIEVYSDVEGSEFVVVSSFIVESLARMTTELYPRLPSHDVESALSRAKVFSEKMISSNPTSIWTVKSAAALVEACQTAHICFSEKRDELFDKLLPNLRMASHFLRLHSLQILASFGTRSFVTDHAELDLRGDLDEEQSPFPHQANDRASAIAVGASDLMDCLLSLEASPVNIETERHVLSFVSKVEVLARCGRLPVAFAEAAANHMLGLLHVKFSPIWPAATRAFVALGECSADLVWPSLYSTIVDVMKPSSDACSLPGEEPIELGVFCNPMEFLKACGEWESSRGCNSALFRKDVLAAKDGGRVSRHQLTDHSTKAELVWRVLEEADNLLSKKSREIVPIFLDFLKDQYFVVFDDDPIAREIPFDTVERSHPQRWKRDDFSKGEMLCRLLSILKAFGVVKNPGQLFKSGFLRTIYTAFLAHNDFKVAQMALNCLGKFKLVHITPYIEHLRAMLKRFELRESLLKCESSLGEDKTSRKSLLPVLSRILFGRLSARATGSSSSKDSPAARRAAILAFLSRQYEDDNDLYPFVYLMVRPFVPKSQRLKPVEDHTSDDRLQLDRLLKSLDSQQLIHLMPQVFVGFLHLLEAVVSQLGHKLRSFVPQLISIVLAISDIVHQRADCEIEASTKHHDMNYRVGAIRSLCFRRLSDIYLQFSSTVDFSPFTGALWAFSSGSIATLPDMVQNSEKVPALLHLLRTLSSHPILFPVLISNDHAINAVFLCVCNESTDAIMDAALSIIENLLADNKGASETRSMEGNADSGMKVVVDRIPLLLRQFASRLKRSSDPPIDSNSSTVRNRVGSVSWRRELDILCRISEVALKNQVTPGEGDQDCLENLCDLLIPFLCQRRAVSEADQMKILGILKCCWSKIGKEASMSHFESLSRLLGPVNGQPGITSLQVRSAIAAALLVVADRIGNVLAPKVATALAKLCSYSSKRVDELDYEVVIPTINALFDASHEYSWITMLCKNCCAGNETSVDKSTTLLLLSPLVYSCCHQLFDVDGVVSRGAFKAVKTLVGILCPAYGESLSQGNDLAEWANNASSLKFLEGTLIPLTRKGLNARNLTVRKYFLLILSDIARGCRSSDSPNLYGDLSLLTNDDDQDLDFFLNITHVQIHRRTRAFQRLRKLLSSGADDSPKMFTLQSLSNVLLPLALHPIYESRTKAEEAFALEAIETAGALARHLSWSKYHSALWTMLTMFERHPEQERYLLGAICAFIDGFHFDVNSSFCESSSSVSLDDCNSNSVFRTLEKRLTPRIEGLMTKEKRNRDGAKTKTLRATVVLALFKLYKKFPKRFFEDRLSRLLAVICSALKERDSDAREVARNTLAKMASELDIAYLGDILRELAVSLTEGYQVHVRSAALHSILLELSKCYRQTLEISQESTLDYCVPAIMDLIQQDLFGEAKERRDANGAKVRFVKEASGSKGLDSIEVVCTLICFHPSRALRNFHLPSIHAIITPLLERLRTQDVNSSGIRSVAQCLQRVVAGLTRNPTVSREELLPFVYATIEPFIVDQAANKTKLEFENDDKGEMVSPLSVSKRDGSFTIKQQPSSIESPGCPQAVVEWQPFALMSSRDSGDAQRQKVKEARELRLVQDGANAPKLTGSVRQRVRNGTHQTQSLSLPANVQAVLFGLNLLQASLKRLKPNEHGQDTGILDPFVSLLTTCACDCRDMDLVLVAMRCLILLLPMKLPSFTAYARPLGTKALDILSSSGGTSQIQSEAARASFKIITLLMKMDKAKDNSTAIDKNQTVLVDEGSLSIGTLPLDCEQMVVLVSIVQGALAEAGQLNQALGVISALVSRRFLSPEFYDSLEKVLELSVRSHTESVRSQASNVFMQYLLYYPMDRQRVEQHLKQVVLNTKYEYEAGRLSAIGLATALTDKLPAALLEEYAQLFFLPLVLHLGNDDSKDCREALAKCISRLLKRVSLQTIQSLYEYVVKWSEGAETLQRTSLELFGLFVDARGDFMSREEVFKQLIDRLDRFLGEDESSVSWEVFYFALKCLEKLSTTCGSLMSQQTDVLASVVLCLKHSHPWVKGVSTRIIFTLFSAKKVCNEGTPLLPDFFVAHPAALFNVAQNLCSQIEADSFESNEESSGLSVKTLVRVLQAMSQYPHLSLPSATSGFETKDPTIWVITRLSQTAKAKRPNIRAAVFKVFAAFATSCSHQLGPHLELMLEPLHRSITEATNELDNPDVMTKKSNDLGETPVSVEAALAKDVVQLLEEKFDAEDFLKAYGIVKTRAKEKKAQRKISAKTEAAVNPEVAAKRKAMKHDQEKKRRKRRNEEHRRQRGGLAKKRSRLA